MELKIRKATKEKSRGRIALHGPSGCGKTYTALRIGTAMGRTFLIDTEFRSSEKYADKFDFDVFDEPLENYHPRVLANALREIPKHGYEVIVCDSLTHFWNGTGGFLELVDEEVKKMRAKGQKGDSHSAWKSVDMIYKDLLLAIHTCHAHVITTMRAKMAYDRVEENGRTRIQKIGLAPEMRDNFQYEMDVEGMLNIEHDMVVGKTRCDDLDGKIFHKPGEDFAHVFMTWLNSGAPARQEPVSELDQIKLALENAKTADDIAAARERATAAAKSGRYTKAQLDELSEPATRAKERAAAATVAA